MHVYCLQLFMLSLHKISNSGLIYITLKSMAQQSYPQLQHSQKPYEMCYIIIFYNKSRNF